MREEPRLDVLEDAQGLAFWLVLMVQDERAWDSHGNTMNIHPSSTNATQAKDRLYGQLAASIRNMSRAVGQTADLFEQLQTDLDAMRVLAGTHAAQYDIPRSRCAPQLTVHRSFMTAAAELNAEPADEDGEADVYS